MRLWWANRVLRSEREILSQAVAWFAQENRLDVAAAFKFVRANQSFAGSLMCQAQGASAYGLYFARSSFRQTAWNSRHRRDETGD